MSPAFLAELWVLVFVGRCHGLAESPGQDDGPLADAGEVGPIIDTPPETAGGPDRGWSPPLAIPPIIKDPRRNAQRSPVFSARRHNSPPLPLLPAGGDFPTSGSLRSPHFHDRFRLGDYKLKKPPQEDDGENSMATMPRIVRDNMRVTRMRESFQTAQRMNKDAGFQTKCLGAPCRPLFDLVDPGQTDPEGEDGDV